LRLSEAGISKTFLAMLHSLVFYTIKEIEMRTVLLTLVAGLAMVFATSTAEAGGGTKPNSTIRVVNDTGSRIAIIVDPSTTIQNLINGGNKTLTSAQLTQFKNAGGKIINAGATANFSVKAGPHTVAGAEVDTTDGDITTTDSISVTTKKGKTVEVTADDNDGDIVLSDTTP
jgi:hypothetical protein